MHSTTSKLEGERTQGSTIRSNGPTLVNFPSEEGGVLEAIDPYKLSISLQIQNRRRRSVNSVDEIGSPEYHPATALPQCPRPLSDSFDLEENSPITKPAEPQEPHATVNSRRHSQCARSRHPFTRESAPTHPRSPRWRHALDERQDGPVCIGPENPQQPDLQREGGTRNGKFLRAVPSARSFLSTYAGRRRASSRSFHRGELHHAQIFPTEAFANCVQLSMEDIEKQQDTSSPKYPTPLGFPEKPKPVTPREYIVNYIIFVIQQVYLHLLLRLPYLYWSRVSQILLDANMSLEQMKNVAYCDVSHEKCPFDGEMRRGYFRLKTDWESFIDNLLREWKTLNIISGLLLSGILTIFQIDGADKDPITRYMAFWSLLSALLSLMYGCFFIIRFSAMRRVYKALEWAIEVQKTQTVFWNVWIMLAMPAIWLVWSIIAYIACIMAFMWRVRPNEPGAVVGPYIVPAAENGFRIFICCVLGIGILYALLILGTLRHYGSTMDAGWKKRVFEFRRRGHWSSKAPTPVRRGLLSPGNFEGTPSAQKRLPHSSKPSTPQTSSPIDLNIVTPTPPSQKQFDLPQTSPLSTTSPFFPPRPPFIPRGSVSGPQPSSSYASATIAHARVEHLAEADQPPDTHYRYFPESDPRESPDPDPNLASFARHCLFQDEVGEIRPDNGMLGLYLPQHHGASGPVHNMNLRRRDAYDQSHSEEIMMEEQRDVTKFTSSTRIQAGGEIKTAAEELISSKHPSLDLNGDGALLLGTQTS